MYNLTLNVVIVGSATSGDDSSVDESVVGSVISSDSDDSSSDFAVSVCSWLTCLPRPPRRSGLEHPSQHNISTAKINKM